MAFGGCVTIRELENKILNEGQVFPGDILKVGSFLNQQIDVELLMNMGDEIRRLYKDSGITKILTIESSGIAVAFAAASKLGCPMVFAKKHQSLNMSPNLLKAKVFSFTHKKSYDIVVSKEYISPDDKVLIVDDFLAKGNALLGLIDLVKQSGAEIAGAAIAIEKGFQDGGDMVRAMGIRVESLAIIDKMNDDGSIIFRDQ